MTLALSIIRSYTRFLVPPAPIDSWQRADGSARRVAVGSYRGCWNLPPQTPCEPSCQRGCQLGPDEQTPFADLFPADYER